MLIPFNVVMIWTILTLGIAILFIRVIMDLKAEIEKYKSARISQELKPHYVTIHLPPDHKEIGFDTTTNEIHVWIEGCKNVPENTKIYALTHSEPTFLVLTRPLTLDL